MALGSTIYNFEIDLSDTVRQVYESVSLRAACHSSESTEFLVCRVLAYCCEYKPELEFSKGLDDPEMPAIWARDLTGTITDWIEIGTPSAEKLHKASKNVPHVSIYTHKKPEITLDLLKGHKIHRAEEIKLYSFNNNFIAEMAALLEKKNIWEISRNEDILYLNIKGADMSTPISVHALS